MLVGLQLPGALRNLVSNSLVDALLGVLLVSVAVIGTRLLWSYTMPYVIRALDRRPQQRLRRVGARQRLPTAWAGFRGGVSLAAALAVPTRLADGSPFAGRDLIVVVTFGVIGVTLLVQGLTLPAVLSWARLPDDGAEAREQRLAERAATRAGLAALPDVAARLDVSAAVADRVRADYEEHLHFLGDPADDGVDPTGEGDDVTGRDDHTDYRRLRAALLVERAAVVRLRDAHKIDDIVLRRVQARLDAEEVRIGSSSETDAD